MTIDEVAGVRQRRLQTSVVAPVDMPRPGEEPLDAAQETGFRQSFVSMAESVKDTSRRQVKGFGSCRCSTTQSATVVCGVVLALAGTVIMLERLAAVHREPATPECGVWPDFRPCTHCIYGTMRPPHSVTAEDTCDSIAQQYGVPQFDLFNRNKSRPCCHVDCGPFGDKCAVDTVIAATDIIDICCPPTIEQWNRAGHPQRVPDKIVATFIGATPSGIRAPLALPEAINVGYLFETSDNNGHTGEFTVGGQFTDGSSTVCAAQVDPTQPHRGPSADSSDGRRLWTFSWGTSSGRWSGSHPEEWAEGAAVSHHLF